MAKRSKQKTIKVEHKGITYVGTFNEGTLKVRTQRTARGNNLIRGVYDPYANKWHNDDLPTSVKQRFEAAFA